MNAGNRHYTQAVDTASWGELFVAIKNGANWREMQTSAGLPILGKAVADSNLQAVESLLNLGVKPQLLKSETGPDFSPLWGCLERKNLKILKLLLDHGADPNEPSPSDLEHPYLPLHYTSQNHWIKATLLLCQAGAWPDGISPQRTAPQRTDGIAEEETTKRSHSRISHFLPPSYQWAESIIKEGMQPYILQELLNRGADPELTTAKYHGLWDYIQHILKTQPPTKIPEETQKLLTSLNKRYLERTLPETRKIRKRVATKPKPTVTHSTDKITEAKKYHKKAPTTEDTEERGLEIGRWLDEGGGENGDGKDAKRL